MRKTDWINYKANTVLDKPLIALNEIMLLWLFLVLRFTSLSIYTCSYSFLSPSLPRPIRAPVAYRTPQALQTPRSSAESRSFYRYRTGLAADVARNGETGGKCTAGSEPCPLHQVLRFIDLIKVGNRFKAGPGLCGRHDLRA